MSMMTKKENKSSTKKVINLQLQVVESQSDMIHLHTDYGERTNTQSALNLCYLMINFIM